MSPANLRRRVIGLERALDRAWRTYIYGWMLITCAAGLLVCAVLVLIAAVGVVTAVAR